MKLMFVEFIPKCIKTGTPDVDAQRSLEGRMACTGSSFEAPLRFASQDEVVGSCSCLSVEYQ